VRVVEMRAMQEQESGAGTATFVRVLSLAELPPGRTWSVTMGEYEVGLFNIDGEIYAIDDVCPHVDGPLHSGKVDQENKVVTCPLHAWDFSLITGKEGYNRRSVACFDTEVRDGDIYVASVPRPLAPSRATAPK
jgi:nitrite reductase/ring-hydroxylating ferredoxin subunit